ncbi:MAG: DsbA family oxidoreductase [Actinobacteria bacterium]|nr:DsbA family oxidoreductase [Actinomycetota bacterium]
MKIEVWSDVVCPWCYVGKRNIEAALAGFPHAAEVEVEWKAYELNPTAPAERPGSYVERIAAKYGVPVGEARARMARIISVGAAAGIDFRFESVRPGNTFDAHRLLRHAATLGRQSEVKERLFAATFTEGRPVGVRETLLEVAAESGMDVDEARRMLESRAHADAVRADEAEGMELGVQGVPFFVFDRRVAVGGAQPPEVMLQVLDRVL